MTGAELDPGEITAGLQLAPTVAYAPEPTREFRSGAGIWALIDGPEPDGTHIADQIARLSQQLTGHDAAINELRKRNYRVEILVTGWIENRRYLDLDLESLKQLHAFGLPVNFTVHREPSAVDLFFDEMANRG
ncbi:DUF4279 domain-containing protein [Nocardia camponoti]|uniref:DUF4279 domain-containing protein n=1 Tax=Nocardia camponoti TaxID=1616106 RepID=UPI001664122B|nr:DUF4279 domain-containing protein [Nocardia camponoti]